MEPMRILRLRASGAVNCKDVHHEFNVELPCARCRFGRNASVTVQEEITAALRSRAKLPSSSFVQCFARRAIRA